jgi:hypothetical protein
MITVKLPSIDKRQTIKGLVNLIRYKSKLLLREYVIEGIGTTMPSHQKLTKQQKQLL